MRRTIFCALVVLVVAIISSHMLMAVSQESGDNYGKVIGQIVDQETGEPVNEVFRVIFYDSKSDGFVIDYEKTDANGRFSLELIPNIYYISIFPMSENSKYCILPSPFKLNEEKRHKVKIEKGKITQIQLKALIGGGIKIYTADLSNVKFNPQEKFDQKFDITAFVKSPILIGNAGKDDLNDGELTVGRLYQGIYSVEVKFEGLGFSTIRKDNILVEKGKVTDVLINIDLSDNTGIEGIVTDANGMALGGVSVTFTHKDLKAKADYEAITNESGYYILKGILDGDYYMSYHYNKKVGIISFIQKGVVEIKKNVLKRLDIQIQYTKNELDN